MGKSEINYEAHGLTNSGQLLFNACPKCTGPMRLNIDIDLSCVY